MTPCCLWSWSYAAILLNNSLCLKALFFSLFNHFFVGFFGLLVIRDLVLGKYLTDLVWKMSNFFFLNNIWFLHIYEETLCDFNEMSSLTVPFSLLSAAYLCWSSTPPHTVLSSSSSSVQVQFMFPFVTDLNLGLLTSCVHFHLNKQQLYNTYPA